MKQKNFLIILILISIASGYKSNAQSFTSEVKGRVLDASDGKPIVGVNVFISGTMWGTSTDLNGYYHIKKLPADQLELVVSMIGYEADTKAIRLRDNSVLKMDVHLKQKIYEYGEIEVAAERPDEWKKNLIDFKKLFLGISEFAVECRIENEIMIDFSKSKDGILAASSREPLVIKNNALGFEINCIIQKFIYDEKNQRVQYKISPTFRAMEAENEVITNYWKKNRRIAYEGSLDHFLKTLKVDSIYTRGYKVETCESPMWKEFRVSNPITTSDSLLQRGFFPNEHILYFPDYLRVTYKDPYVNKNKVSFLHLPYGRVTIDEFGYLHDDMGLEVLGDWTLQGIADMLPKYYYADIKR